MMRHFSTTIAFLIALLPLAAHTPAALAAGCDRSEADSLWQQGQESRSTISTPGTMSGGANAGLLSFSAPVQHDDWLGKAAKLKRAGRLYAKCLATTDAEDRWTIAYAAYRAWATSASDMTRYLEDQPRDPNASAITADENDVNGEAISMAYLIANDPHAPNGQRCQFAMLARIVGHQSFCP